MNKQWHRTTWQDGWNSLRIFDGDKYIAIVGGSDDDRETIEENARLIAAAPELLAACEGALSELNRLQPILCDEDADLVQSAIEEITAVVKKAGGGE